MDTYILTVKLMARAQNPGQTVWQVEEALKQLARRGAWPIAITMKNVRTDIPFVVKSPHLSSRLHPDTQFHRVAYLLGQRFPLITIDELVLQTRLSEYVVRKIVKGESVSVASLQALLLFVKREARDYSQLIQLLRQLTGAVA